MNARISPEMMQFIHKLVSTFDIGLEQSNVGSLGNTSGSGGGGPLSQESLAKQTQVAPKDRSAFLRLKTQFTSDFDFSSPGAKRLHNLMSKLKRWIKILELKTKSLQK